MFKILFTVARFAVWLFCDDHCNLAAKLFVYNSHSQQVIHIVYVHKKGGTLITVWLSYNNLEDIHCWHKLNCTYVTVQI